MSAIPDNLSRFGAGRLAKIIESYWRDRGFPQVKCSRYEANGAEAWGIKSNLVNGLPPQ